MPRMKHSTWVSGLNDFGLTKSGLRNLGPRPVTLEVTIRVPPYVYPSIATLRRLVRVAPTERRALVRQWRAREYAKLCREMPFNDYGMMRFNGAPSGLRITVPARSVHR